MAFEPLLIDWLFYRMRLLDAERQNYEQNPSLTQNVKAANIEIIQSGIEGIGGVLNEIIKNCKQPIDKGHLSATINP